MTKPGVVSSDLLLKKGIGFQTNGKLREAEACYREVLAAEPDNAQANNLMGLLALAVIDSMDNDAKQSPIAIRYFRKAVESEPRKADFHANLGAALLEARNYNEARKHLRKAVDIDSRHTGALCDLGCLMRHENKYPLAEKYFRRALSFDPRNFIALSELGGLLVNQGKLDDAIKCFQAVLSVKPGHVPALAGLAEVRKAKPGDPVRKLIETRLKEPDVSNKDLSILHFSAGKVLNDLGEYEGAIDHFNKAKIFAGAKFDIDAHAEYYDQLISTFDKKFFDERQDFGSPDDRLVFIVGMPRSGTTLTEQIAASHSRIHGAGETTNLQDVATDLGIDRRDREKFVDAVKNMTREDSRNYAEELLATYRKSDRKAVRIVEKMPHNFQLLQLVALLFPNARVVHCRRDPMDNCLSIYSLNFNEFHGYTSDMESLGLYYRQYVRLMDHWARVVPLRMITMKYEETVADLENRARALIDFIGVEWEDSCLRFHETERSVATLSRSQVRQPIYTSSVKRWKRYGAALDPLKEALGDLVEDD